MPMVRGGMLLCGRFGLETTRSCGGFPMRLPVFSSVDIDIGRLGNTTHNNIIRNGVMQLDSTLVSFFVSSLIVSFVRPINSATMQHSGVIDYCGWKLCLPASLALSVFGTTRENNSSDAFHHSPTSSAWGVRWAMLGAFLLGSLGSIVGGYLSYIAASRIDGIVSNGVPNASSSGIDYAACAACLASSYIGGTANFFETASALKLCGKDLQILKSFAAADIFVMLAYFSLLNWLKYRYSSSGDARNKEEDHQSRQTSVQSQFSTLGSSSCCAFIALLFSMACDVLQSRVLKLPGTGIIMLTAASVVLRTYLTTQASNIRVQPFLRGSSTASSMLLNVFYFLLGLGARMQDVVRLGAPIAGLFATLLSSHLLVLLVGSTLWNGAVHLVLQGAYRRRDRTVPEGFYIDIDTILIASNACVGGASTAASMAGAPPFLRPDLMISASAVGVLGYLMGTQAGLGLYRLIRWKSR